MKQFVVGVLVTIILSAGLFSLYQATQAEGAAAPAAVAPAVVADNPVLANRPAQSPETESQSLPAPAVVDAAAPVLSAAAGTIHPQPADNSYGHQQATNTTPGTQQVQAQTHVTTTLVQSGTVQTVELTGLSLLTSVGEPLSVQLGPSHFWSTQGVTFSRGDQVTVNGFTENGQVQAISVSNDSTGQLLTLRDASGRPLWAGGNGNGGNGYRGGQG
jgi:hypothetical protein